MVRAIIFVEGGGDSKELHARCREGFRKLLEKCGFTGRMPRIVACGGRNAVFDDFKTAHAMRRGSEYVAMLIDSENPLADLDATWQHLAVPPQRWSRPLTATDDQVLFMTTCMETWIVADRFALAKHYVSGLQITALPPLHQLEGRERGEIQESLEQATQSCSNAYKKGKRSFVVLGLLGPDVLEQHLPSFSRTRRVLNSRL